MSAPYYDVESGWGGYYGGTWPPSTNWGGIWDGWPLHHRAWAYAGTCHNEEYGFRYWKMRGFIKLPKPDITVAQRSRRLVLQLMTSGYSSLFPTVVSADLFLGGGSFQVYYMAWGPDVEQADWDLEGSPMTDKVYGPIRAAGSTYLEIPIANKAGINWDGPTYICIKADDESSEPTYLESLNGWNRGQFFPGGVKLPTNRLTPLTERGGQTHMGTQGRGVQV